MRLYKFRCPDDKNRVEFKLCPDEEITDVTDDYLIDFHKLQYNLRNTGYGEVEIMVITQLLIDNYDGVILE